jgi:hypothetical protein
MLVGERSDLSKVYEVFDIPIFCMAILGIINNDNENCIFGGGGGSRTCYYS